MEHEITFADIEKLLEYNPETGIFIWKINRSRLAKVGSIAGGKDKNGYIRIMIKRKKYGAHRLAWFISTGKFPRYGEEIDHINGNTADNKLSNLRVVSHRMNGNNRKEHRLGKLPGALFNKRTKKWEARIQIKGKKYQIGSFETNKEANCAYVAKLDVIAEGKRDAQED